MKIDEKQNGMHKNERKEKKMTQHVREREVHSLTELSTPTNDDAADILAVIFIE